jgi:CDP-diacylglycerol--glycerol-3-phosphate 3-phosphatidyltransferase
MLPNWITFARILLAPCFAAAFIAGEGGDPRWLWVALAMLALIELSDALDGFLARKTGTVSDFGKFFDPLADSMSRLTIFLSFLVAGVIPLWMFLIFLYRDLFVSSIRYLCIKEGVVVPARVSGKLKAIFQALGSLGVIGVSLAAAYGLAGVSREVGGRHIGFFIMLFPALFTAYSAIDYYYGNRQVVHKSF